MFGILGDVVKIAASVVTVPVAIGLDVVTGAGLATDQDKPYTVQQIEQLGENVNNLVK